MKEIVYVTGNPLKIDLLKSVLDPNEFSVVGKDINCPEIQNDSIEEVAKFSAKFASDQLKADVLKNDSGLVIPALNGFPSAYSKYVEEHLTAKELLAMMKGKKDRSCYYLDAYAYCQFGKEPVVFVSISPCTVVKKASGKGKYWFDTVIVAKGHKKTMAHLPYNEFLATFDRTGIYDLAKFLKNEK